MMKSGALLFAAVSALAIACGATTSTSGSATDDGANGPSCNDLQASARSEVDGVLQAHRSCTQASDCVGIELTATCFDSCGRAIRADGQANFQAATAKVDGAQCKQFLDQRCKNVIPPCAPPSPVACTAGLCTN
jgi:hypothetical protein